MLKPMRFRKKPIVIEAMQIDMDGANNKAVYDWASPCVAIWDRGIMVATPIGHMLAKPGDWIIREINGAFYVWKDEIFRAAYEEA